MKTTIRLVASCALLGLLASCGKKDAAEDTATTTETTTAATAAEAPTTTEAPAETAAATTAPGATFDLSTVPVSSASLGAWPYLSGLKGYHTAYDSDSTGFDFDRAYVYDGKNLVAVEGRIVSRHFRPVDSEKPASELMQQRNYENLIKSLGGVKVSSGEVSQDAIKAIGEDEYEKHDTNISGPADTYVIRQKDKEVWVQMQPTGSDYVLNVIEKAGMQQQAGVVNAADIKKN
jgi:hypothetical protein